MMLDGLRVLDLTRLLPGGYCTRLLADMGAGVIKIEALDGDPLRHLPGGGAYFEALHHGKRSVALRLKHDRGRRAMARLAARSDVLVEGFRPGAMRRLGLDWADLTQVNPRLIYCSINGYGSDSPLRQRAGHDLNYLARSGGLSLMPKHAGIPAIPGMQVADLAGGQAAAVAILAALLERARTGTGRKVEISMTDVMKSWIALPLAAARTGIGGLQLTGELPCYHVYAVKDGFLTVAALELQFWQNFCEAIGRQDLVPRQSDSAAVDEVAGVLRSGTRAHWMEQFAGKDVCVEPCLTIQEVLAESPAESRSPAPAIGEHTEQVLREAGLDEADITALKTTP